MYAVFLTVIKILDINLSKNNSEKGKIAREVFSGYLGMFTKS